eukprot:CAMPEP_0115372312 /NCGR_PEP_ID=MMETSP0271-20121206/835_1 /TAXON_ID=71861 /ORGANISM="Scrippsiella trochoidea, Strain CCMP3099" /LENGTH=148 /DNA_ID=CAMNT_0002795247 /DNA_START=34 /DNA_END=476 /DNA_ORIENTATION=+
MTEQGGESSAELSLRALEADFPGTRTRISDAVIGVIIALNMVVLVFEIDEEAGCISAGQDYCTSFWISVSESYVFLSVYVLEFALRVFAYRRSFFDCYSNIVDALVVAVGMFDAALSFVDAPGVNLLRLVRAGRLVRSLRILRRSPTL